LQEQKSWNGSAWTEVADLNTARSRLGAAGTQPAALVFGGGTPGVTAVTEQWNGTSWTEVADLATARFELSGRGTTSNALAFGGATPTATAATEEWNTGVPVGAWSTGGDLNTGRQGGGGAGVSNSSGLYFGGSTSAPTISGLTESYDGTSWTEVNDLNSARQGVGGNGTQTSALVYGGSNPATTHLALTESLEWNFLD
jgi:hypothetical protein